MQIFSTELILFIVITIVYFRINKSWPLSLTFVRGLVTYIPPVDEDFDLLQKSSEGPQTDRFDHANKFQKKKTAKPRFPLRSFTIDAPFLKHCNEFYIEYDFIMLLLGVVLLLFVIGQPIKLLYPQFYASNLTLYLIYTLLALVLYYVLKPSFVPLRWTDEFKIELLFAIKSTFLSYVILSLGQDYFEFPLDIATKALAIRANEIAKVFGGKIFLTPDVFSIFISLLAGLLSFSVVRPGVKSAYYFYVLNQQGNTIEKSEDTSSLKKHRRLLFFARLNFFFPVVVMILFAPPLSKSLVVPEFMSSEHWNTLRCCILVLGFVLKRMTLFEEIQF